MSFSLILWETNPTPNCLMVHALGAYQITAKSTNWSLIKKHIVSHKLDKKEIFYNASGRLKSHEYSNKL